MKRLRYPRFFLASSLLLTLACGEKAPVYTIASSGKSETAQPSAEGTQKIKTNATDKAAAPEPAKAEAPVRLNLADTKKAVLNKGWVRTDVGGCFAEKAPLAFSANTLSFTSDTAVSFTKRYFTDAACKTPAAATPDLVVTANYLISETAKAGIHNLDFTFSDGVKNYSLLSLSGDKLSLGQVTAVLTGASPETRPTELRTDYSLSPAK